MKKETLAEDVIKQAKEDGRRWKTAFFCTLAMLVATWIYIVLR